jgi:hypothetical protein
LYKEEKKSRKHDMMSLKYELVMAYDDEIRMQKKENTKNE